MARLIDHVLFPELFGEHFLFGEDDHDIFERRQYRLLNRQHMNHWDDVDFFDRFRITKEFFIELVDIIRPILNVDESRYL